MHAQLAQDCYFVTDLELSRVLLMNDSNYPWCILVPRIDGVREVYELSIKNQALLASESVHVSRFMMEFFAGQKMNVASLGNMVPQLHIHHIVRKRNDAAWPKPVWGCASAAAYVDKEARIICGQIRGGLTANDNGSSA